MRLLANELAEAFRIAFAQIRANALRSVLTALGVIIGIVAVTLMGTAILGINAGVEQSLSGFGDDLLYVDKWPWQRLDDWIAYRNRPPIRVEWAQRINEWIADHPNGPLKLAIPAAMISNATVLRGENRLDNINVLGTTEDMPRMSRSELKEGRFFSEIEARSARNVVVLGYDVAEALFPAESALGKPVQIRGQQFAVVGIMARQGSFLGLFSWDSMIAVPINTFRRYVPLAYVNPQLRVQVDVARMDAARDELRGLMRRLRQLRPEQKDNFEINEQQLIRNQIDPIKNGIAFAGLFITGLALFVGAIGIMNITYVSVKERTREIGTRKALGARRRTILLQFLIEAVSICLIGGVVGLLSAWGTALVVGSLMPSFPLVFSLGLVVVGLLVSVLTGVFSGFFPAWQASKLDPVVALRYE